MLNSAASRVLLVASAGHNDPMLPPTCTAEVTNPPSRIVAPNNRGTCAINVFFISSQHAREFWPNVGFINMVC